MRNNKTKSKPPIIRSRDEHIISRKNIDPDALKVLYRLNSCGFTGYLVGGSVRDLLLGRHPKDFDISTDAHPNQIRRLFRNAFLIGRRFRLAHIRFGTNIIETSTFRREPEALPESEDDDALLQQRDNTFGSPEEDARRRDFTVNGLFYDVRSFSVIDHVGGLKDLEKGIIRCIGDPDIRFREDPVRMIRAVRFAARLGFRIERRTYRAIVKHHKEIAKASAPRVLEEIYRLFGYQSGEEAFRLLRKTGLMRVMLPDLDAYLDKHRGSNDLFWKCLEAHDREMVMLEATTPALMWGALYCAPFRRAIDKAAERTDSPRYAEIARDVLQPCLERYRMPKKVYYRLLRMLTGQQRLDSPRQRFSKRRFVIHESFPETIELYGIYRAAAGLDPQALEFWHELHREHARDRKPEAARTPRRRRRRSPRRGRSGKSTAESS